MTADEKIQHFINLLQTQRPKVIVCNDRVVTLDEAVEILRKRLGRWRT